jgi:hypothetical protein
MCAKGLSTKQFRENFFVGRAKSPKKVLLHHPQNWLKGTQKKLSRGLMVDPWDNLYMDL